MPLGEDFYDAGGPTTVSPPPRTGPIKAYSYRSVAFQAASERVFALVVTDLRARTRRGAGVGDSLARIRAVYPNVRCFSANEGSEYPRYPACEGRVGRRIWAWFGRDPVRSISLASRPLGR